MDLRIGYAHDIEAALHTRYAAALTAAAETDFLASERFVWSPFELTYDSPDKADPTQAEEADNIVTPLVASVERAEEELIVVSPYFVPLDSGIEWFRELRERGIEVIVVTNSLAANNHVYVHSGYAPARKPLLEMGVKLYEARGDAFDVHADATDDRKPRATLHTKAFIVDRKELFVGSFNWDPRSVDLNTELGVIIHSEELARQCARDVEDGLARYTYEVVLTEKRHLQWIDRSGEEPVVHVDEPQSSVWRRFAVDFMRILPIKGQL